MEKRRRRRVTRFRSLAIDRLTDRHSHKSQQTPLSFPRDPSILFPPTHTPAYVTPHQTDATRQGEQLFQPNSRQPLSSDQKKTQTTHNRLYHVCLRFPHSRRREKSRETLSFFFVGRCEKRAEKSLLPFSSHTSPASLDARIHCNKRERERD